MNDEFTRAQGRMWLDRVLDDNWLDDYFDRMPASLTELIETGSVEIQYGKVKVVVSLMVQPL